MVRALLFDLDNTLFDTYSVVQKSRTEAVLAMIDAGLPATREDAVAKLTAIIKKEGSNFGGHFNQLCQMYNIPEDPRIISAGVGAYHNVKFSLLHPFPGVKNMLVQLVKKGYKLGIVTNGIAIKQWDKIHRLGIEDFFDTVKVSDSRETLSSKDELLKSAVADLGVAIEDTLFIGDSLKADIASANRIGMRSVLVARHNEDTLTAAKESAPTLVIRRTPELLNHLEELA